MTRDGDPLENVLESVPRRPRGPYPRQRAVVFLFYYADLSIADIADATGSNRIAVRVQLHRAREALRRRYGNATAMREWSPPGGTDEQLVNEPRGSTRSARRAISGPTLRTRRVSHPRRAVNPGRFHVSPGYVPGGVALPSP